MSKEIPKFQPPLAIGFEQIQDLSVVSSPVEGFLRRHRHRVKTVLSNQQRTETYLVDYADRSLERRDAVAVCAFAFDPDDHQVKVLLRQQARYALYIATGQVMCLEIPAGLIENNEAVAETAARELFEETGLSVAAENFVPLGAAVVPSPGSITERIFLGCVETSLAALLHTLDDEPPGDGSPMEEGAGLIICTLEEAIVDQTTQLCDAKTEICLRRLRDHLAKK